MQKQEVELTNESLGIDLGIKDLAIVSNKDASITKFYKNINKTAKIRRLEKKLRREQRKLSRKLEAIKDLAIVSNKDASITKFYKNINKTAKIRRLEKKLRREQRKLSRKLEANIKDHDKIRRPIWKRPLRECANMQKQNRVIQFLHKKLTNIRNNYLHQTTAEIVKTKPSRIVMEDLNVKGIMKTFVTTIFIRQLPR